MFCSKFAAQSAFIYIVFYFFFILLITIVFELLWPTQFFNKVFNIGFKTVKVRTYVEVVLKNLFVSKFFFIFLKNNYKKSLKV